jgi:hypothetical protein
MKLTLHRLVACGFFPSELPPPFKTGSFARFVSQAASINFPFDLDVVPSSRPEIYYQAKHGTLRRSLAILNPIHFAGLAHFVVQNWSHLKAAASKSSFSLTTPEIGRDGRAIGRKCSFDILAEKRADIRSRGKYLVRADISRFYQSIYTHSVPWAIHGRRWSKKNRRTKCIGNDLDKLLQKCQEGQTNGIPIGPDTSLLIAEIILSKADASLMRSRAWRMRYMDDYELVVDTEGQALEALAELQHSLLQLELHLNPFKTAVIHLPDALEYSWTAKLRAAPLDPASKQFRAQVIRYFDAAFALANQFPTAGVLKYAIGRVAHLSLKHEHNLVEDLLLQVARIETGTLPLVLEVVLKNPSRQARKQKRTNLLLKTIIEHGPQRHSSEVAWSIWGCIALQISLPKETITAALQMEDSVCALLLLHAQSLGLANAKRASRVLEAIMNGDELYDSRWLLSYEGSIKGWINCPRGDHVTNDYNFGKMKAAGVSFYDIKKTTFPRSTSKRSHQPQMSPSTEAIDLSDIWEEAESPSADYV